MPSQIERVGEYLNLHIGKELDIADLARKLEIPKRRISNIVGVHYSHRLDPPEGRTRVILAPDGPEPISHTAVSKTGPRKEEPIMIYPSARKHTHKKHSDEIEMDSGSE
jgi:hypothetical protein